MTSEFNDSATHRIDEDRNPVDLLADEFAQRIRQGETPSIEEYAGKNPDLADDIRTIFPTIAQIEKASRNQYSEDSTNTNALFPDPELEHKKIGDFQIIRQLGRGGMGIVYEALQISLHRHVALKVVSPIISQSPKQLARFEREAATAARLHHTNIVPVFGSGEEKGIHYYAMQLIDGIPLHQAVRQLKSSGSFDFVSTASTFLGEASSLTPETKNPAPSHLIDQHTSFNPEEHFEIESDQSDEHGFIRGKAPADVSSDAFVMEPTSKFARKKTAYYDKVCECVADIADALQYAHDHKVLHRDIKPSNLLMDRQGTVWVTDFGLAKFDDHEAITRTGDMVGTLRYMSPEQLCGEGDTRSDICSLGLTLYELLVLQPAYQETRSAHLIKIKSQQPPQKPSKIDSSIPSDLDTIVLKACAVDPRHRYQTARAFRDDLIRFVEGRPIAARKTGLLEQSWRWSKRNPLVASLASLTILLLASIAIISWLANQTTQAALRAKQAEFERAEKSTTEAQKLLEIANTQKTLANMNFSGAIRAFEEIMQNISSRGIPHGIAIEVEQEEVRSFETSLTQSDVEILETLLKFFAEFAEQNKADLNFQSAEAYRRVADIQKNLGRLVEAEESFEQAIKIFHALDKDQVADKNHTLVKLRMLNEMAYCANRRGIFEDAESYLGRGRKIYLDQLHKTPELLLEYARSLNIFTAMYSRVGFVINQRAFPPRATRPEKTQDGNPTDDVKTRRGKPQPKRKKFWLSVNHLYSDKKSEIMKANSEAIDILLKLIEVDSKNSTYQLELSRAFQDRVRLNRQNRIASQAFEQAKSILQALVDKHPNNPAYRFELVDLLCNLEKSRSGFSNPYAAVREAKKLVDTWPTVSEYRALFADAQARSVIQRIGEKPGGLKKLEESVNIYRELVDQFPDYFAYKINFSQYLIILATQYVTEKNKEEAKSLFHEAENCLLTLKNEDDTNPLVATIFSELETARRNSQIDESTSSTSRQRSTFK